MFDPHTLATLAMFMLPPRQSVPNNIFQDFTGGGYFYLDNQDRVVASTTTRHIYVIAENTRLPDRQSRLQDLLRDRSRLQQQLRRDLDQPQRRSSTSAP